MTHLVPGKGFGFLLADVARLFRQSLEKEIETSGLTLTGGSIRALAYIATYDALRQSALADLMDLEPMTVSVYVDVLESHALVMRAPDAVDRRAKIIRVTDKGHHTLKDLVPIINAAYQRAICGISQDRVSIIEEGLSEIRNNLAIRRP